ncbi:hypothetical protein HOD38_00100 [archaeon]|jgi:hypothetical protein|nr:hypothetical protein [archaeon]MBT4396647.1 hypothetical protein [archaeon]MBT4441257.1 hypothetical protein [archaeon]
MKEIKKTDWITFEKDKHGIQLREAHEILGVSTPCQIELEQKGKYKVVRRGIKQEKIPMYIRATLVASNFNNDKLCGMYLCYGNSPMMWIQTNEFTKFRLSDDKPEHKTPVYLGHLVYKCSAKQKGDKNEEKGNTTS